jgi:hypothetical protein
MISADLHPGPGDRLQTPRTKHTPSQGSSVYSHFTGNQATTRLPVIANDPRRVGVPGSAMVCCGHKAIDALHARGRRFSPWAFHVELEGDCSWRPIRSILTEQATCSARLSTDGSTTVECVPYRCPKPPPDDIPRRSPFVLTRRGTYRTRILHSEARSHQSDRGITHSEQRTRSSIGQPASEPGARSSALDRASTRDSAAPTALCARFHRCQCPVPDSDWRSSSDVHRSARPHSTRPSPLHAGSALSWNEGRGALSRPRSGTRRPGPDRSSPRGARDHPGS